MSEEMSEEMKDTEEYLIDKKIALTLEDAAGKKQQVVIPVKLKWTIEKPTLREVPKKEMKLGTGVTMEKPTLGQKPPPGKDTLNE